VCKIGSTDCSEANSSANGVMVTCSGKTADGCVCNSQYTSAPTSTASYTTAGTTVTVNGVVYNFCVTGDQLTIDAGGLGPHEDASFVEILVR